MIDPITAMAAVSSAVSMIKKASAMVDDVRSLGPLLGKYFDAKHNAVKAVREAKKTGGSNMGKAIEIELALKQQADFEKELQMLFMQTGNIDVWNNIKKRVADMEAEERREQHKEAAAARRRKQEMEDLMDWVAIGSFIFFLIACTLWGVYELVAYCRAHGCGARA
jgi:hypothetical protein